MYELEKTTTYFIVMGIKTVLNTSTDEAVELYRLCLKQSVNEIELATNLYQIRFMYANGYRISAIVNFMKGGRSNMTIEKAINSIKDAGLYKEIQFIRYDNSPFVTLYNPRLRNIIGTVMKENFDDNVVIFTRRTKYNPDTKSQIFQLSEIYFEDTGKFDILDKD